MRVPRGAALAHAPTHPTHTPRLQYLTREGMEKAGLPTPRNARINAPGDVEPAGTHVGFPAVIKPVSGAARARAGYAIMVTRRRKGEHRRRERREGNIEESVEKRV